MFYDERHKPKYDVLYGYTPSWKEWRAEQRQRKTSGRFSETEYSVPWHCGWKICRDGGYDYNGEWESVGSWTCKKIIRPSYDQLTAVSLVVKVYGRRMFKLGERRTKPRRWAASVELGGHQRSFFSLKYAKSCNSLADACRKAEKLSFLDVEITALLKQTYSPLCAESLFCKEGADYLPYATRFRIGGDPSDWPYGSYFRTNWNIPYMGPDKDKVRLEGSSIDVSHWGSSIGPYREPGVAYTPDFRVHHAMVQKLGCWLPKPEEPAQKKIA